MYIDMLDLQNNAKILQAATGGGSPDQCSVCWILFACFGAVRLLGSFSPKSSGLPQTIAVSLPGST
jgi:hypothetical protein